MSRPDPGQAPPSNPPTVGYAALPPGLVGFDTTPLPFRMRRMRNWFFLGLLYAAYYLCRYNLSTVTPEISQEFGLNNAQTGWLSTGRDFGYAIGTFLNGLFADALGGKQSMAIGAAGTIVLNLAFGAFSHLFSLWDVAFLLTGFIVIRTIDGYAQSFGSPGMVKINTAWFRRRERGRFAGIFGGMIQLGMVGVNQMSAILLTGVLTVGGVVLFNFGKQDWRIMFIAPPLILAVITVLMWLNVKNHPEQTGWRVQHDDEVGRENLDKTKLPLWQVFNTIAANPLVWVNAGAYMCTGFVRRAYDFWWAKYMFDQWSVGKGSWHFVILGFTLPIAGFVGSFMSGLISDNFCKSRRSPVATGLYFIETLVILAAVLVLGHSNWGSAWVAVGFLTLISLTVNSSHSIIGTAVAMDIGGRQMAGFALGIINSFQYVGAIAAGFLLGALIDWYGNWDALFLAMLPFSILGTLLMLGTWIFTRGKNIRGA
ncbi:MAG: MFS transporter [Phycisphaerales bacterium]|nr:MFS transporter [Phycisphaerales bacterium]